MLAALLGALSLFHAAPAKAQAPAAPTGLSVTASDANLAVSWTASTGAQRYHVHYTSAAAGTVGNNAAGTAGSDHANGWINIAASTTVTSYNIGVPNDITFRVRVRANNASGNSAWVFGSGTAALFLQWLTTTANSTEGATTGLELTISPNGGTVSSAVSATVTYAPGSSNPASLTDDLQTGYATTVSAAANSVPTVSLAIPVDDTVNEEHETYTVTINAGTGYTVGTPSTLTVTIADNDPPPAPALTVRAGEQHLTASWTKPAGPVEWYNLRYKEASAPDQAATGGDLSTGWVTNAVRNSTSQIITGLTRGTAYHVQVRANDGQTQTGNGDSDWSALQTGTPSIKVTLKSSDRNNPTIATVNEGKKAVLNLGFSDCKNNNYVGIPVITTRLTSESRGWRLSRGVSEPAGSPDVLSYGPDHDFGLGNPAQRHTLTPPTHSCGSGDVYIDTYRDCDTDHETFTVELDGDARWPPGYGRGSQYKVEVTIIDDGGQEFCTPPPARQPADQPPPNTEETDTDGGTPVTPSNTGGSGGGGGGFSGGTPAGGPPTGGGGGLPPSGSSDEPPPEDDELSTLCSQEDRKNLERFYEMTDGESWDENENWNSEEPLNQWYGVETDEDENVVSLRLSHNALSGEVPARELLCLSELKELALWGNDLPGEVPEKLVLAVERAVLRDIAEMLKINPEWFENYGDPYNFEDWHEGVTTDDDGRVVELDLTGEGVLGEVPESSSELKRLREIMITRSSGGCALNPKDNSSAFSLFLLALLVFAALGRTRARG